MARPKKKIVIQGNGSDGSSETFQSDIDPAEQMNPLQGLPEEKSESSSNESDYSKHPKFNKFNLKGKK